MQRYLSQFNSAASILFWLWGVLIFSVGVAIGYSSLTLHNSALPLLLFASWGVAFCVGGFALPRRRWGVRWWASLLCNLSVVALLSAQVRLSLVGVAINVLALSFILISWRAPRAVQP